MCTGVYRYVQSCLPKRRHRPSDDQRLTLDELQVAEQARPGRGVRFRKRGKVFPGEIGLDLRDICRGRAGVLCIAAVNRPTHAAHQCGYFGPDPKFAARAGFDEADTLDATDLCGFGPLPPSHVHLGVIYAKRFDLDDDMARLRFGVGELLDHQAFRTPKLLDDDCTHEASSRLSLLLSTGLRWRARYASPDYRQSVRSRNSRMTAVISAQCVSNAKWPVS